MYQRSVAIYLYQEDTDTAFLQNTSGLSVTIYLNHRAGHSILATLRDDLTFNISANTSQLGEHTDWADGDETRVDATEAEEVRCMEGPREQTSSRPRPCSHS